MRSSRGSSISARKLTLEQTAAARGETSELAHQH
jgi:hypothetical protein